MARSSWIGKSLGNRYAIESLLGQGGMSAVFKAEDPNLRRTVAVKLIHPHLSGDPQFVSRFESEASSVAQLRHPNIIQVFDFDHDDDTYYMVMEFVPGETLQDRLKRLNASGRRMDPKDAVKFAAGVCDALDYAHKRGMVHRDIKPANIMLTVTGEVVLMDFGIAKIVGGKRHTATGAVVGTALYMAPEQIKGEQIDPRADIYAMGVTLFEMLSGRPPFEADSAMTVMMMHVNDPVPNLASLNPNVPPEIVQVVGRALAKDRNQRYHNAAEFAAALRNVFAEKTVPAAAPSPTADSSSTVTATKVDAAPPDDMTAIQTDEAPRVQDQATAIQTDTGPGTPPIPTAVDPVVPAAPYEGTVVDGPAAAPPAGPTPVEPQPAAAPTRAATPAAAPSAAAQTIAVGGFAVPRIALYGGAGLIIILLVIILGFSVLGGGGGDDPTEIAAASPTAAEQATEVAVVIAPTETPLPPTATATITTTPTPTLTSTITPTPTMTDPPPPFVRITEIRIENSRYVVEYETFGYTEELPGMHVHFYYDTVTEENAGAPGSGPWILYGGPRPFQEYTVASRPAQATQMCARVANPNHSIIPDSGICMDLPES